MIGIEYDLAVLIQTLCVLQRSLLPYNMNHIFTKSVCIYRYRNKLWIMRSFRSHIGYTTLYNNTTQYFVKKKNYDHFVLINRPRWGWICRAGIIIFLKLIRSWENINITFRSVIYRISTRVFASIFHCTLSDWICFSLFIFWYNFYRYSFLFVTACFRMFSQCYCLWSRS